jgi:hypothetical protein
MTGFRCRVGFLLAHQISSALGSFSHRRLHRLHCAFDLYQQQGLIDQQIRNASQIVNTQASQVKDLAGHHTARATETVKAYAGDYSAKAQNYIGSARGRSSSPEVNTGSTSTSGSGVNHPLKSEPGFLRLRTTRPTFRMRLSRADSWRNVSR